MNQNTLPPLLYQGSVKNVRGLVRESTLVFEYTDKYSIFDWGEMPDQIPQKGEALNLMGQAFFKYLEKPQTWRNLFTAGFVHEFEPSFIEQIKKTDQFLNLCETGLPHHFISLINKRCSQVKKIAVHRPPFVIDKYDYQIYQSRPVDCLVPLEVIFRFGLVKGNSLTARLEKNPRLLDQFNLPNLPLENQLLKTPLIDFSTKLEKGDRYIDYAEVQKIAGLTESEFTNLKNTTLLIGLALYKLHQQMNLTLWDGKVEFAFIAGSKLDRNFMLVDSIGLDELRLIREHCSLSKEFLREIYKKSNWYKALQIAKTEGPDFKNICVKKYNQSPENLNSSDLKKTESLYKSYCNEVFKAIGSEAPFAVDYNLDAYIDGRL